MSRARGYAAAVNDQGAAALVAVTLSGERGGDIAAEGGVRERECGALRHEERDIAAHGLEMVVAARIERGSERDITTHRLHLRASERGTIRRDIAARSVEVERADEAIEVYITAGGFYRECTCATLDG